LPRFCREQNRTRRKARSECLSARGLAPGKGQAKEKDSLWLSFLDSEHSNSSGHPANEAEAGMKKPDSWGLSLTDTPVIGCETSQSIQNNV
jgi:hypothetical protein